LGTFVMEITKKEGRSARTATMEVRSASVTLHRPRRPADQPRLPEVKVNVVWVRETKPPTGEKPVEWMLLTSLPVETFAQACLIADYYACRWQNETIHPHYDQRYTFSQGGGPRYNRRFGVTGAGSLEPAA